MFNKNNKETEKDVMYKELQKRARLTREALSHLVETVIIKKEKVDLLPEGFYRESAESELNTAKMALAYAIERYDEAAKEADMFYISNFLTVEKDETFCRFASSSYVIENTIRNFFRKNS